MTERFGWPAPAKLNLFLHITGRRHDGYHLLQTVFQLLDYGDTLYFEPRDNRHIEQLDPIPGVPPERDLCVLAARLLQRAMAPEKRLGIAIGLDKVLPMGGGLGGGSSNAATTLVALNEIWRAGLSVDDLAALGLKLGADVPVFVRGNSAWGSGIGEKLQPIPLSERWFVVIAPPVHISTAELFSNPQLTRDCSPITIRDFRAGADVRNVFQDVVCSVSTDVKNALSELFDQSVSGGETPRMTGSGACVFLACKSEERAHIVLSAMSHNWDGFVAKGVGHSPLQATVGRYLATQSDSVSDRFT